MTEHNAEKKLARELQRIRACRYTAALEELREIPLDQRRAYVERVAAVEHEKRVREEST